MSRATYIPPPKYLPNSAVHRTKMADAIAQVMQGRINVTNTITFDASGTTELIDPRIHPLSFIFLSPRSEDATLLAHEWYVDVKETGRCVIKHPVLNPDEEGGIPLVIYDVLIIG